MATFPILSAFARNWWAFLVRGIFAVLFGLMAFTLHGPTLLLLILLYGTYAVVDGMTALWVGERARAWGLVLLGVLGILVGVFTFVYPDITTLTLLYLIAAWAIVRGFLEIITAIQLRKEISNEWALIAGGILSVLFGVVLFARPAAGALAMTWLIGAFVLVLGVMMILFAFRIRGLLKRLEGSSRA